MQNRIYKFRAWDDLNKIMRENVFIRGDVIFAPHGGGENEIIGVEPMVKLMQFTGLKDKHGKKIYFGDILQTSNDNPEFDIWTSKDYGYAICYEDPDELGVRFKNWYPTTEEESVYNFQFVEIIGNIYQNPELLK